jgi:uncharacterized membrane protein
VYFFFARKHFPMNIGDEEELKLEDQLSELGRVVDDAARNLFNLTIGASTTLSHANALLVIFILSAVIFAIFSLTYFAASSVFTGYFTISGSDSSSYTTNFLGPPQQHNHF